MRALITGAAGFAGRHLTRHLLGLGWEVAGLSGRPHPSGDLPRFLVVNLLDADLTRRTVAAQVPEVIFHLAAQSYVPQALADPAATLTNNILAQLNVLEAATALARPPLVVVASSAEVYGVARPEWQPLTESAPLRPANPYAVSKVAQDMLALQYYLSDHLPTVRARPFNHLGPGQSDRFVVANFARQIAEAEAGRVEPVMLVGNLEAARDFLDVRDVVAAYAELATPALAGEVFNVASGSPQRIADLLAALLARATVSIEVRPDPARLRPSDTPLLVGDATRLTAATGWRPRIPLDQTLDDVLSDWRARVGSSRQAPES